MQIQIEGFDLPGGSCGPGPDFPGGHHHIHVGADPHGHPTCASVRPPAIGWSAPTLEH